jgi:hypothetical protein
MLVWNMTFLQNRVCNLGTAACGRTEKLVSAFFSKCTVTVQKFVLNILSVIKQTWLSVHMTQLQAMRSKTLSNWPVQAQVPQCFASAVCIFYKDTPPWCLYYLLPGHMQPRLQFSFTLPQNQLYLFLANVNQWSCDWCYPILTDPIGKI